MAETEKEEHPCSNAPPTDFRHHLHGYGSERRVGDGQKKVEVGQ